MKDIYIDKMTSSSDIGKYIKKHLNKKDLDISFVYKSLFKNTKYLRYFIEKIILNLGIDKSWVPRFILIVDEMNNNAIEYGSKDNEINYMRFKSKYIKEKNKVKINIEVEDTGNGKKHKKAVEMIDLKDKKSVEGFDNHTSIRGRGLFLIINKLVDELYFKDSCNGGLIVGIEKELDIINK